jgi:uncharacterized protein (TIGR03435 family)
MKKFLPAFLLCLAMVCGSAFGQTVDVASIRAAAPPQMRGGAMMMMMNKTGGPGSKDPTNVVYNGMNLTGLLVEAYDIKRFQLSAPQWADSERFDIKIKIAEGTTKEQYRVMLQHLLAERFKAVIHKEQKELPTYDMVVAKNGLKMKASAEEPPAPVQTAGGPDETPAAPKIAFGGPGSLKMGKDGFPELPAGTLPSGPPRMMVVNGKARLQGDKSSMADLANALTRSVDRPVMDKTGLPGKYDFTLIFALDTSRGMPGMGAGGVSMVVHSAGGGEMGGGGAMPGGAGGSDDAGPTVFAAVQEQLGLKLEAKKSMVDMVVVDSLEKVPTEN